MKKQKECYLKIPYHILNLSGISLCQKVLLAYVYSFGAKGCWQSNATLAQIFMVSPCTISRWLTEIRPFLYVKNPRGYSRTFWARSHPDGQLRTSAKDPPQQCQKQLRKSAISAKQERVTTRNHTIKEIRKDTIASPSPLPAGGQAPATLQQRRQKRIEIIEKFKARFGCSGARVSISQEEYDNRRALIRAQLLETAGE